MAKEYSIKDLADILDVSKTTIRKAIQKEQIEFDSVKSNKQLYSEAKARQIILSINADFDFANSQTVFANLETEGTNQSENNGNKSAKSITESANSQTPEMKLLIKTIDILEKQLEQKDKQIDSLNERLEQALTSLNEQSHEHNYITATDKQKQLIEAQAEGLKGFTTAEPPEHKSLFAKIFKR